METRIVLTFLLATRIVVQVFHLIVLLCRFASLLC